MELDLSPQQVNNRVRELSEALNGWLNGGRLIEKDRGEVFQTEAGKLVFEFAQDFLKRSDKLLSNLSELQYGKVIRALCVESVWNAHDVPLLNMFEKGYRGRIDLHTVKGEDKFPQEIVEAVARGDYDIGLINYPPNIHGPLTCQLFKDQEMRVVMNAKCQNRPKRSPVSIVELVSNNPKIRLLLHEKDLVGPFPNRVRRYLGRCKFDLNNQISEEPNIESIMAEVRSHENAISILPADVIAEDIEEGIFVSYALNPPMEPWTWGIIYRRNTSRPAVKAFVECMRPWFK